MLTYEIEPSESVGWSMAVMQDGEEIAGGTFPAGDEGYCEALEEAEIIIESMGGQL